MENKIRLAMCDDLKSLCIYFKNAFFDVPDIDFVGMSHSSKECIEMVRELSPDVLLLDIQIEAYDSGINIIPHLKEISPDLKIIMLTIHKDSDKIYKAFTYGACGYQLKSAKFEEILSSVRKAARDNTATIQQDIFELFISESNKINSEKTSLLYILSIIAKLTHSEIEILYDIGQGLSYKEIAKKRVVEEITIRSQISRLLKKFGAVNVHELKHLINELNLDVLIKKLF